MRNLTAWATEIRAAAAGVILTAIGFVATYLLLGWVNLSRAVTDPVRIWTQNLTTLVACAVVVALAAALLWRLTNAAPWWSVAIAVVVFQGLGSAFVAPLAVGELGIENAPTVFAIVSGLGALPAAAAVGAWLGQRLGSRGTPAVPVAR